MYIHYQITDVQTGDSATAIAMEQLCGHVVSPAMREHAIMEEMFSVTSMLGYITRTSSSVTVVECFTILHVILVQGPSCAVVRSEK
jgi:hypothetical protein